MKFFTPLRLLSVVAALALVAAPAVEAREVTVRRDLDGDGHYNTKKYDVRRGYRGNYGGNYGGRYYGNSYGRGYGYGYRNYGGYGYSPYGYGYPSYYGYGGPSVSFSYSSRPSYYAADDGYSDGLAVDVQRALKRRGYYGGAVDGDIGPGSRSALRSFQAEHGLSVTGRIDRSTLRALGI